MNQLCTAAALKTSVFPAATRAVPSLSLHTVAAADNVSYEVIARVPEGFGEGIQCLRSDPPGPSDQ
jgi:hypothetical protein